MLPEGGKLKKMKVELVSLRDEKLVIETESEAIVRLENIGNQPIKIPWSRNYPDNDGQEPDDRSWEAGLFKLKLTSKRGSEVDLKNMSQVLLASETVTGSKLTLKPGEWISAQIKFRVEVQHPEYEKLEEGESKLLVEWFQTNRTYEVKDCGFTLGYYPYDRHYYQQENPAIGVKVVSGASLGTNQSTSDAKPNL
jgi:hypothetical protein